MAAPSEVRHDALSGGTVLVAVGRAARPHQFEPLSSDPDPSTENCPFCPGHESMTPPEVARAGPGEPDARGWRVRVVPNLYPIVDSHEVVVLSPDHRRSFGSLDDAAAVEVFAVLRDRAAALVVGGRSLAVAAINHGRAAGASLPHPHAQVFGLDFVPHAVADAVARFEDAGTDLVVRDAQRDHLLSVSSRQETLAWCPYASGSPYVVRVAARYGGACFRSADESAVKEVALAVRDALAAVARVLGDPPYNVVVHDAPQPDDPFHWYVEITPRVSVIAGFELATGLLVNTVEPRVAASELRAAIT